ncbi:hypothetical protein C9374_006535 [Naegleria lovaniensis]|uniref:Uncharacterized protein n=1 Tax=Naegleria lovaniensis TaxID=51637 RepID=A0AA88GN95_NAELO|nr:uncharacterized protein C9374_006535 [Naegleria lovaniensis]KAG2379418.1 hypothetical protein C9374_006535 [Naegleria lovaniensis]
MMEWNCCGIKPLALFLTFFIFFGSGLMLFGVLFGVLGPVSTNPPEITTFNDLALRWQAMNRQIFTSYKFNLTATLTSNAPVPSPSVSSSSLPPMPSPSVSPSTPSHLSHFEDDDHNFDTHYSNGKSDKHAPGVALPPSSSSSRYISHSHSSSSEHATHGHPSSTTKHSTTTSSSTATPPSTVSTTSTNIPSTLLQSNTVFNQAPFSPNTQSDVFHPDNPFFLEKYDSFKFQINSQNPSTLFTDPIRTNFSKALMLNITWSSDPQKMLSGGNPGKNKGGGNSGGGIALLSFLSSIFSAGILNNHELSQTKFSNATTNTLQVPLIYLFLKTESPIHQSSSGCRYGFLENGKCYLVHRLREVCIKVKVNDAGTSAQLDDTFGGIGCGPTDVPYLASIESNYSGLTYIYSVIYDNQDVNNHTVLFSDLVITLRSSKDPYVYAEYITNGTLNFQPWDKYYHGNILEGDIGFVRGFFGFGSLGLGVLIVFPSVLFCFIFCFCSEKLRRKFMVDDMREEHALLLNLTVEKEQKKNLKDYLFPNTESD